jgi:hypothetical protein
MYGDLNINYKTVMDSLSTEDQLTVWSWILGQYVSIHQNLTSPFRPDRNPSCYLRQYKNILLFTDYGEPQYNKYTCLHAIQHFMGGSLNDAAWVAKVHLELNIPPLLNQKVIVGDYKKHSEHSKIHYVAHMDGDMPVYTQNDKEYWSPVGVTTCDLREMNVYSLKYFYLDDRRIIPSIPSYAYVINNRVKIYSPKAPSRYKWMGNTKSGDIWQTNLDQDKLLITKSLKDLLVLKKLLPDWKIIVPQNEGVSFNYDFENYKELKILFDPDTGGFAGSERLLNHIGRGERLFFNKNIGKDAYDCGMNSMTLLNQELKRLKLI